MGTDKVLFANALRGVAALSVIVGHYLGVFWTGQAAVFHMTGIPDHRLPVPIYVQIVNSIPHFNWGAFGVAIFFVISGFVIPFSFQTYGRADFLIARLFRIYPTYIVGLTIGLATLLVGSLVMGTTFPNGTAEIAISYALGYRDIAWSKLLDGVVWTLEVELKFYLICAILAPYLRETSLKVFVVPVVLCVTSLALGHFIPTWNTSRFNFVALCAPYLQFMFVGVALNYFYRGAIGAVATLSIVCALYLAFAVSLTFGFFTSPVLPTYAIAIFAFVIAMIFPATVTRLPSIHFWAKISYPFYVVHALAGYVLLHLFLHLGAKAWMSLIFTFALVSLASLAMHETVEQRTHRFGRRLAERVRTKLTRRNPLDAATPAE